eukprot:549257_1
MGEDSGKADSVENDGEQNDNKTVVNDKNKEENVSGTGSSESPGKVDVGKMKGQENETQNGKKQHKKSFHVMNTRFDISPSKYRLIRPIGYGAYGLVVSAEDCKAKRKVAIKKIGRAFDDLIDGKRILREIKLLRQIKHDNIIGILDIIPPRSFEQFQDVYIVSYLMETDLNRIIYSKQPLSTDHIQYFIYQVLRALKYLHSANILHRDLKPSNLLLNSNCDLKVCDLGLARGVDEGEKGLTEYVVTRWYRAPEIMLSCKEYTKAIDVWSTGCIFAELLEREPFFPGDDYIHQLKLICEKVGRPHEDELHFITSPRAKRFILSLPDEKKYIKEFLPNGSETALDLLEKMLQFNPNSRITVDDALAHPFMKGLHNEEDEPESENLFEFEFEKEELSRERLQQLVWNEILHYHPNLKERKEEEGNNADTNIDQPVGEADTVASPQTSKNTPHSATSNDYHCSHLGEEFIESPESPSSKKQKVA